MSEKRQDDENPIVIYTSQDGQVHVNVRIEGETAWLTQAAMAQLFGCTPENVLMHLKKKSMPRENYKTPQLLRIS